MVKMANAWSARERGWWLKPVYALRLGISGAVVAGGIATALATGAVPAGAAAQRPQCDLSIHITVDAHGDESYGVSGGCHGRVPTDNQITRMLGVTGLIVPVYREHGQVCEDQRADRCFIWVGRRISLTWDKYGTVSKS